MVVNSAIASFINTIRGVDESSIKKKKIRKRKSKKHGVSKDIKGLTDEAMIEKIVKSELKKKQINNKMKRLNRIIKNKEKQNMKLKMDLKSIKMDMDLSQKELKNSKKIINNQKKELIDYKKKNIKGGSLTGLLGIDSENNEEDKIKKK